MLTGPIFMMGDQAEDSASEDISDTDIESFILDKELVDDTLSVPPQEFLFAPQAMSESVILPDFTSLDPETQERVQALLQAAGITKIGSDGRTVADPDLLKRLTSSVSNALDEAAAAITRMKSDDKSTDDGSGTAVISTDVNGGGAGSSNEEGESLLSLACSAGYYELAQVLLAMRTNVEDRGTKGDCTPLMEAASAGHADIVKLLIAHGADVNAQSSTGNTPLMYACASGHEDVVRVLLEAGADVELHNENGHSPLMEAASAGHVSIARLLVDHGAQVNAQSTEFKVGLESPLTLACYKGHLHMVRYLLQVGNPSSPGRQEELHTALMEASMDGHVEVARLLLDAGAKVNLPTDSFESPLTLAACGGHAELAKLLLERGANLEEPNDEGYTPLMEAAREGHEDVCRLLLEWQADVNAQTDETGETALTLACCGGFQEVAALLLDRGADIEAGANTPLMEAAQEGHADLVRFLIKRGADANACTASGDTPLTYAAENGHTDVCLALLDAGADLEHGADGGRTALMKAARAGHDCTLTLLMSKGADPNRATTANDHTALSLACTGGHLTTVELLLRHGADPQRKLKDGTTCIMEAAKGGHTIVVQMLLDWPTTPVQRLMLPPPTGAAVLPSPEPGQVVTSADGTLTVESLGITTGPAAAANLLPQFNLQLAVAAAASGQPLGSNYASLAPGLFSYPGGDATTMVNPAAGGTMGPVLPTISAAAYGDSEQYFVGDEDEDEKDALTLAQTALLQQASEKLSPKDYQKLQELLKAQFQETAAQLANRMSSGNGAGAGTTVQASTPRKSAAAVANNNNNNNNATAKSKKAELEQAMKELEQLKKTQHLYEQIQKALEAKAAAAAAATGVQNEKTKAARVKSAPGKTTKEEQKKEAFAWVQPTPPAPAPVPPPPPAVPPPPPPPPAPVPIPAPSASVLSNMVQSGQLQFQLPQLDQAQMQFLQQQCLLALQQQQQQQQAAAVAAAAAAAGFQFPAPTPNSNPGQMAHPMVFPECTLPVVNFQAAAAAAKEKKEDGGKEDSTPNIFVPIQVPAEYLQAQQQQPTPPAAGGTTAFNLPVSSVGFNFTPQHLLPPPPALGSTATELDQKALLTFPISAYAPPQQQQQQPMMANNTKGTQTPSGNVYQPQPGAFQPPTYQGTATDIGDGTGTVVAPVNHQHSHHHQQQHGSTNLPSCQQQHQHPRPTTTGTSGVDLNTQTESNHDTALTLACAGGHEELVLLLLQRGADIEHRDKKGFTPLILAATAGHAGVVEILLEHGANVEAQSERTKDTALSLACSGGRRDVVEILLKRGANKEHRNVSDYTPLSLAASGGYTDIIQLLLQYGAEINSRTGSKLGISPLMLAAMNGHTQAVKMLLERHADINAQIETNRNTALTLACFQGRHEVVKLLLEHRALVEHRAKTGLTPLMEAASGGYVEVGKVLLQYGADVNCAPVPASRDTALTIAADKGHAKFVELLLQHGAQVDCKTKKGCTALWLAANGGHVEVVQALVKYAAQVDEPDNRRVTPLMAAFRKGHVKLVKWLVRHVQQFPSDQECTRYLATVTDKDLLAKCRQAMDLIMTAKDRQEQEANKAAAVLLQELEQEQQLAETRRAAKQRQKEKKKMKRQAKKAGGNSDPKSTSSSTKKVDDEDEEDEEEKENQKETTTKEPSPIGNSSAASGSRSISPSPERLPPTMETTEENARLPGMPNIGVDGENGYGKKNEFEQDIGANSSISEHGRRRRRMRRPRVVESTKNGQDSAMGRNQVDAKSQGDSDGWTKPSSHRGSTLAQQQQSSRTRGGRVIPTSTAVPTSTTSASRRPLTEDQNSTSTASAAAVSKNGSKNDWQDSTAAKRPPNKILVSAQAIARVIGRGGQNINAIREASGAHIEVEKQQKGQTDRLITIRGTPEGTKQAILMINGLINEPDMSVQDIVNKVKTKDQKTMEAYAKPRPPSANAILKTQTPVGSVTAAKANGFPEISVWVPTTTKAGRQPRSNQQQSTTTSTSASMTNGPASTKSAATTTTTVPSTSSSEATTKTLEYSPFGSGSTLNVWQQRAYLLQQKKRADFASVAASGLANPNVASNPAKQQMVSASAPKSIQQVAAAAPPTLEDLSKAPGYRQAKAIATPASEQSMTSGSSLFNTPDSTNQISPQKPIQSASPSVLNEAAQAIAAATAAMNNSSVTPPPNSHSTASYYSAANIDVSTLDDGGYGGAYFSTMQTPKTSFSSPTSFSQPQTQRNSLGFDNVNVAQMAALYEQDNGRRSAGAAAPYFAPIALPRPASATASVNRNDETATPPPVNSDAHNLATLLQQLQQQQVQAQAQEQSSLGSFNFPTPIGGERGGTSRGGGSRGSDEFSLPTLPAVTAATFASILDAWGLATNEKPFDLDDWSNDLGGLSADLARLQASQQEQQSSRDYQFSNNFDYAELAAAVNGATTTFDSEVLQQALLLAANWQQQQQQQRSAPIPQTHDYQQSHQSHQHQQHMYNIPPPPFSTSIPPPGFSAPPPPQPLPPPQTNVPPPPLGMFHNCQPVWSTTEREWKFSAPSGRPSMLGGGTSPGRMFGQPPGSANGGGGGGVGDGYGYAAGHHQAQQAQQTQPQAAQSQQQRGWSSGWNSMALQ